MEILLNGNALDVEGINDGASVLELVDTVEKALKGSGRTVVDIILDGTWYSPDNPGTLGDLKITSYKKIELGAATAKEMVLEGFKDAAEGLTYLENIAAEISSDLRLGRVKEAMTEYVKFVDAIEWLVAMFKNADRAFAANMAESSLEIEREAIMKRLAEQMAAIEIAQVQENWIEVADILEYEFSEIFTDVKVFVEKLLRA